MVPDRLLGELNTYQNSKCSKLHSICSYLSFTSFNTPISISVFFFWIYPFSKKWDSWSWSMRGCQFHHFIRHSHRISQSVLMWTELLGSGLYRRTISYFGLFVRHPTLSSALATDKIETVVVRSHPPVRIYKNKMFDNSGFLFRNFRRGVSQDDTIR